MVSGKFHLSYCSALPPLPPGSYVSRVLCSDKDLAEGLLLISPSHCVCPHCPFTPGGHLLLWARLKTSIPMVSAPQMPHPKSLPLRGSCPPPGGRTCRTCFSPQTGGISFESGVSPLFSQATKLFSNPILPLGFRLSENKSQNLSASHSVTYLPYASDKESTPCSNGEQKKGKLQTTLTQGRNVCCRSETDNAEKKAIL